jgi:lipoic acid synthetase
MSQTAPSAAPGSLRGASKLARIPVKVDSSRASPPKPSWLRARDPGTASVLALQQMLREQELHTVCEEADCPNIGECFARGTATFMIMGSICTRRCPYCDVAHGRPAALDADEPARLARTVKAMKLRYVVVTSVDRDDLRDGGAGHFTACIAAIRAETPAVQIEVLTPDFRGREQLALEILGEALPDVFNHNLETVSRLYRAVRPGGNYAASLRLIADFKARNPAVPTKSGLMLGLGETDEDLLEAMRDLRAHHCDILTLGQYLRPSPSHLPVERYVPPEEFERWRETALGLGFVEVAAGPLVRSSYRADQLAAGSGLLAGAPA